MEAGGWTRKAFLRILESSRDFASPWEVRKLAVFWPTWEVGPLEEKHVACLEGTAGLRKEPARQTGRWAEHEGLHSGSKHPKIPQGPVGLQEETIRATADI